MPLLSTLGSVGSKLRNIVSAASKLLRTPEAGVIGAGLAAKGFRIPRLFTPRAGGLLAAAALGAAGLAGATEIAEDLDKKELAAALVELAIMANPAYAAMSEREKDEAIEQLADAFDKDPVLYAQAKQVYQEAKKAGII